MDRLFVGVDPGKSGAVALLHGSGVVEFCPYTEPGCWDFVLRQERYPTERLYVAVERLFARPGKMSSAKANFELGRCCGEIETLMRYNRLAYEAVTPQRWQKVFGISGDKATHIETAKRLFPHVDLRRTEKCKVSFDGYADALLIATWCAWETLGEKVRFW